ncbi:MAG TPA: ABC transporter permease [Nocardioides sp.]|nr:ABC transporter permease [Nocardioides sp.]
MGTTSGGWRVALRLARREAWRRKGQTVLMLVLICLPVIAVTAAAIVWRTQDVSSVEGIDRRMGAADALVEATGAESVAQSFDGGNYVTPGNGEEQPYRLQDARDVRRVLGDRPMVPFARSALSFEAAKGRGDTDVVETDLASPLSEGLFEQVRGQYPPGPGEVVVNQALADRGPGIGDELVLLRMTPKGEVEIPVRVVGIAESTEARGYAMAAALPGTFGIGDEGPPRWLVGGGPVSWEDVKALNAAGLLATSRQVVTDPPPDSELSPELATSTSVDEVALTALGTVVAMVLLEVVLLAGPAFAVRARAQAHTLALVAASGGTARQARRTVLASGVVIGTVGGVLGVAVGIAAATLAVPIAQHFNGTRFGPFEVPWLLLLPVAFFGFLSAVLAAVVPAFSASRQDVVAVLAGRRGDGRPSRRSPVVGVVLLVLGIGSAAYGSRPGGAAPLLVAVSAIISVLGMILVVPVAVGLAGRLGSRLPLSLRFAARDAARHRTRTVPAVAAVGATVAGVVALGIALASQEARNLQEYDAQLPDGYGSVSFAGSPGPDREAVDAVIGRSLPADQVEEVRGLQTNTPNGGFDVGFSQDGEPLELSYWSSIGSPYAVGGSVPDYVAMTADERARADAVLAEGGLVLLRDPRSEANAGIYSTELDGDRVTVELSEYGAEESTTRGTATVRAVLASVTRTSPAIAVLSPELVEQINGTETTTGLLLHAPISADAQQDLEEGLAALAAQPYLYVERGYQAPPEVKVIQAVLAALGAILMLGGTLTATFLALSDARPDLATMAAVGARPRTRRTVAASYAAVVGLVGALLGAPIGFIPGIAVSRPLTHDFANGTSVLAIPWSLVATVVLGLPLLTALVVGACARGRLPLTARID